MAKPAQRPQAEMSNPQDARLEITQSHEQPREALDNAHARVHAPENRPNVLIAERAAALAEGGDVLRMNRDGQPEAWKIVAATERGVVIQHEQSRRYLSREEAALEERAATFGPAIAEHWKTVLQTMEVLNDDQQIWKAIGMLEAYKGEIMEAAALRAAADTTEDAEKLLFAAAQDVLEDVAGTTPAQALEQIGNVVKMTDEIEALRFDDVTEEKTQASVRPEATGVVGLPLRALSAEEISENRVKVLEEGIGVPREVLAVAQGEIATSALVDLVEQTKAMSVEEVNAEVQRLRMRRGELDMHNVGDATIGVALQKREHALRVENATRETPMELGAIQKAIAEMQANKPPRRGRPVDLPKLGRQYQAVLDTLDRAEVGTSEWRGLDQEAWDLKKRILREYGENVEDEPALFSAVYERLKTAVNVGLFTAQEVREELRHIAKDTHLPAYEREGIRLLEKELQPTSVAVEIDETPTKPAIKAKRPIPFNVFRKVHPQYGVVTEKDTVDLGEPEMTEDIPQERRGPEVVIGKKFFKKDLPHLERQEPEVVVAPSAANDKLEPSVVRYPEKEFFADGDLNRYDARPSTENETSPETYTQSFVAVADAFGGPQEFIALFNELRRNNLLDVTLDDVSKVPMTGFFRRIIPGIASTDRMIDVIAAAQTKLNQRQGIRMSDTFAGKKKGRGKI